MTMLSALLLAASDPQSVVEAERAFAASAQAGVWAAFRATAAHDAVMFVPQPVSAQDWLKGRKEPPVAYSWSPANAFISCDGNSAVTTGPSRIGASPGYFTTVWRRTGDEWKWVIDHGAPLRTPRAAVDEVAVREASCADLPKVKGPHIVSLVDTESKAERHHGASADRSLSWNWTTSPQGGRRLVVKLWNGNSYETVVEDVVPGRP